MVYRYQPLKSRNNEIRVLKLLPSADQSAAICCELDIVSLNDNPIYSALSYCWADPPDPRIIKLHGHDREVCIQLADLAKDGKRLPLKPIYILSIW